MNSHFYHLQINVNLAKNKTFYRDLMEFMGWTIILDEDETLGYKSKTNGDLWFCEVENKTPADYDALGVNHIALRVEKLNDIDEITAMLKEKGIKTLFGTPKHRSEFVEGEKQTYYQIMFESPDKILFEIVYIGDK